MNSNSGLKVLSCFLLLLLQPFILHCILATGENLKELFDSIFGPDPPQDSSSHFEGNPKSHMPDKLLASSAAAFSAQSRKSKISDHTDDNKKVSKKTTKFMLPIAVNDPQSGTNVSLASSSKAIIKDQKKNENIEGKINSGIVSRKRKNFTFPPLLELPYIEASEQNLSQIRLQNNLKESGRLETRIYYICKNSKRYTGKDFPDCKIRCVFDKQKKRFYTYLHHNHPMEPMPEDSEQYEKKRRKPCTSDQKLELEKEFHFDSYNLKLERRDEIGHRLGMTEKQVKQWFDNRRKKQKKESKDKQLQLAQQLVEQQALNSLARTPHVENAAFDMAIQQQQSFHSGVASSTTVMQAPPME